MVWPALYASGLLLAAPHAAAPSQDTDKAQALLDEGRRLMVAHDYNAACPKLASSQALDPAPATMITLATCYEDAGKIASAYDTFRQAEAAATAAKQKNRAVFANKRAAALQPTLSRVTVTVPPSTQIAGLEIRCQGQALAHDQWGVAVAHDGGVYDIEATAPGKTAWRTHVDLSPSKQSLAVEVPPLADASATPSAQVAAPDGAAAPAPEETAEAHPGRAQRVVGLGIGGAGILTLGAAGVLGFLAKSQMNTAQGEVNPAAHNDSVNAVNTGNLATRVGAVGAGVALAGAVVWWVAPRAKVSVGTSGSAVIVRGSL
jgi:hypothetical protein